MRSARSPRAAAICIAVGNTSLEDCPRLTSSFGCTRRFAPRSPPSSSEARFASTSLTFMLLCVPDPVCQTASGNSWSCLPASTSSAAAMMASALLRSSSPSPALTSAAAFFTRARPWITASGMRSLEMRKKRRLRSVCAPHRRDCGTSMVPKLSCSRRASPLIAAAMLLLQQAAQHPRVLLVHLHALRQQIEGRFVVRLLGDRQHLARRAHHGLLTLDQQPHHLLGPG